MHGCDFGAALGANRLSAAVATRARGRQDWPAISGRKRAERRRARRATEWTLTQEANPVIECDQEQIGGPKEAQVVGRVGCCAAALGAAAVNQHQHGQPALGRLDDRPQGPLALRFGESGANRSWRWGETRDGGSRLALLGRKLATGSVCLLSANLSPQKRATLLMGARVMNRTTKRPSELLEWPPALLNGWRLIYIVKSLIYRSGWPVGRPASQSPAGELMLAWRPQRASAQRVRPFVLAWPLGARRHVGRPFPVGSILSLLGGALALGGGQGRAA